MPRTKKLFYVPGLISLVGLFIVLPYFYKWNKPVKQAFLSLFVPMDCIQDPGMNNYSTCDMEIAIRKKKQIKVTLNENKEENIRKLEFVRYEALKLKYTEDTSTIILIILSDSISFGEFVSIVDMCESDKHKRYGFWEDKFVIFGEWPIKEIKQTDTITPLYCGTRLYKKPVEEPGFLEIVTQKIKDNYTTEGLYLCIGFITLLISSFIQGKMQGLSINFQINTAGILN